MRRWIPKSYNCTTVRWKNLLKFFPVCFKDIFSWKSQNCFRKYLKISSSDSDNRKFCWQPEVPGWILPGYNKILKHFRYSCFETDPVWGCLSTAFIFISGIAWSFMIAYSLQRKKRFERPTFLDYSSPYSIIIINISYNGDFHEANGSIQ